MRKFLGWFMIGEALLFVICGLVYMGATSTWWAPFLFLLCIFLTYLYLNLAMKFVKVGETNDADYSEKCD